MWSGHERFFITTPAYNEDTMSLIQKSKWCPSGRWGGYVERESSFALLSWYHIDTGVSDCKEPQIGQKCKRSVLLRWM